jgi:hypothetical protein
MLTYLMYLVAALYLGLLSSVCRHGLRPDFLREPRSAHARQFDAGRHSFGAVMLPSLIDARDGCTLDTR